MKSLSLFGELSSLVCSLKFSLLILNVHKGPLGLTEKISHSWIHDCFSEKYVWIEREKYREIIRKFESFIRMKSLYRDNHNIERKLIRFTQRVHSENTTDQDFLIIMDCASIRVESELRWVFSFHRGNGVEFSQSVFSIRNWKLWRSSSFSRWICQSVPLGPMHFRAKTVPTLCCKSLRILQWDSCAMTPGTFPLIPFRALREHLFRSRAIQ